MSATNSMAIKGQSNHVSPLAAAVALAAIVAVGAVGFAIGQGVGTSSQAHANAAPAVVTAATMSGPRTATQKGLGRAGAGYNGTDFGGKYSQWLAAQQAATSYQDYGLRIAATAAKSPAGNVISSQLRLAQ